VIAVGSTVHWLGDAVIAQQQDGADVLVLPAGTLNGLTGPQVAELGGEVTRKAAAAPRLQPPAWVVGKPDSDGTYMGISAAVGDVELMTYWDPSEGSVIDLDVPAGNRQILAPRQARELAALLVLAADQVEGVQYRATPCTCLIQHPATRQEERVLDRGCPVHGDREPAWPSGPVRGDSTRAGVAS
jgi:hypothetical protein